MFGRFRGGIVMKLYLDLKGEKILSWNSAPVSDNSIEVEVDPGHELVRNPLKFIYRDGELIEDLTYLLEEVKQAKLDELNAACQQAILDGFTHEIDGKLYHFSFDVEAQFNFHASQTLFANGVIEDIVWTAKLDGEYVRIIITKEIMDELTVAILRHKNGYISKYRDFLAPLVQDATTIEEVNSIQWDSL